MFICQPLWMGYAYAVGMVLSSACQAFLMAHYFQGGYQRLDAISSLSRVLCL